ncbi:MAG: TIGR01458 family HAD-type hydrolase, partial [Proteobacteria bacterium]|nr:TIGR01458 family HAD-type hydrolase [Pseudomonadota bacterium]
MLLDLGGVVHVGDEPLPGALDALERLRAAGLPLRYIT